MHPQIDSMNMRAIVAYLNDAIAIGPADTRATLIGFARDRLLDACIVDVEVETFRSIGEVIEPIVQRALHPTPQTMREAAE